MISMATGATTMNDELAEATLEDLAHGIKREYQIPPDHLTNPDGGLDFHIDDLMKTFASHCPDYMRPLETDTKSQAIEFCEKVIYEIGPESRKINKRTGDKVWKFTFTNNKEKHTVFVASYKQDGARFIPANSSNSMILTLEQAGLIVQETFARLIKLAFQSGSMLMTPLAAACFRKDDIGVLAKCLGLTEVDLLIRISQSTLNGGHYLTNSDIDIAICASCAATRNMKNESLAKKIVVKVINAYRSMGKVSDPSRIAKIDSYVCKPCPFTYEELVDIMRNSE